MIARHGAVRKRKEKQICYAKYRLIDKIIIIQSDINIQPVIMNIMRDAPMQACSSVSFKNKFMNEYSGWWIERYISVFQYCFIFKFWTMIGFKILFILRILLTATDGSLFLIVALISRTTFDYNICINCIICSSTQWYRRVNENPTKDLCLRNSCFNGCLNTILYQAISTKRTSEEPK